MEKALHQYTLEPSEKPFDMKTVPLATAPIFEQKAGNTQASWKWAGGKARSLGAAVVVLILLSGTSLYLIRIYWFIAFGKKPFQEHSVTSLAFFHVLAQFLSILT